MKKMIGLETEQLSEDQQKNQLEGAIEKAKKLSKQTTVAAKKEEEVAKA